MKRYAPSLTVRVLVSVLCTLLVVPFFSVPSVTAQEDGELHVINVAGNSRYDTAVEASKLAYPSGLAEDGAKTVVIATGRNWPDALGGTALAGVLDAPILLTETHALPDAVTVEIGRLGADKAIILGGTDVVGHGVQSALAQRLGAENVERIAGKDRYETADTIAERLIEIRGEEWDNTFFVATGANFPDALAGAPIAAAMGWPLLLAHPTRGLSEASKATVANAGSAVILGGPDVVSAATEGDLLDSMSVERLAGTSRYETAAAVAAYGVAVAYGERLHWDHVGIATGEKFPDALAGGVLQAKTGSVMLLVRSSSIDRVVREVLWDVRREISTVTFFGGEGALTRAVRDDVSSALGHAPPVSVTFADPKLEVLVRVWLAEEGVGATDPITADDMAKLEVITSREEAPGGISDLTGLEHAVNLTYLAVDTDQLSDLSPLSRLTNLRGLELVDSQISNITPLASLTNLGTLILDLNLISDLSPLQGLTSLSYLSLVYNPITDISALVSNPGLGSDDTVDIQGSNLDLSPGSLATTHISALTSRGVDVAVNTWPGWDRGIPPPRNYLIEITNAWTTPTVVPSVPRPALSSPFSN